jgi:hypothetical protein
LQVGFADAVFRRDAVGAQEGAIEGQALQRRLGERADETFTNVSQRSTQALDVDRLDPGQFL